MPQDFIEPAKWLAGFAVGLIAWFARKSIDRVEADLSGKADKSHMEREIEGLKMELKESREARERDIARIERVSAEKFAEFSESMRDRLNSMERNTGEKLTSMERNMADKLSAVLQAIKSISRSGD